MARNAEVVRQWELLRDIDAARHGISVGKLAAARGVCARTVRRDIEALSRAGFPLYDVKVNGTSMWKLHARPFRALEDRGLGLMELCALYFSRTLLDTLAGTPLLDDAERAFMRIEKALPAGCRRFLDQLPRMLTAKPGGRKIQDDRKVRDLLARALDATLLHRQATMRYASASSRRTKEYVVELQRIVYADGGIYLVAWVPDYGELRTFAAERIETFGLLDTVFRPRPLPVEPFGDSLGVNTGMPETIVVEFESSAAAYVRMRRWHKSQKLEELAGGRVRVTLKVCNDYALRTWILGFGADARVVSPESLAHEIFEAADRMRRQYVRALKLQTPFSVLSKVG
ncbi:MAG TPA: WYL domain-containing transcriptional regulator [Vicinamibacterales bacterium]|nr:WYL domain-containing transcriptional regulator [Vicinamibacterales bacterium]